jgi:uncharacterized protein YjbJ (UPF0337 family)
MKPSTNDQIKGALHQMKGVVKAKVGHDEELSGKLQKKVGQIEKVFEK